MKKKNLLYIVCALAMGSLCGCDDFLNKDPQDKQTNDTYWQTETSLRTYAQDFYSSYFTGYGTDYTVFAGYFSGDDYTDDFINLNNANTNGSGYIYFSTSATTDWNSRTGTWSDNYSVIYKANVMLEKIPGMNISDEAKRHWEGIARYFRAMAYSTLAKYYGGVPYYDKVTDPADPALYKDRDSYLYVAQKIQEDFQYALDNVRTDDTKRQVNKYVVGAYMSREMLYHATWLKYHGTTVGPTSEKVVDGDIKNLLQGAINGAEAVMNSGIYSIGNTYNALFTTDDLANNPEVIWYREYTSGLQCNALMSYNGPEDQTQGGVTQDVINTYLCSDGLPIGQSPLYQGKEDPSIQKSFQDRDPRLYQTVADSLRIMSAMGTNYTEGTSPTGYPTKKFLNDEWWVAGLDYCTGRLSPADAPCIRYAEVLLNYAEAVYERDDAISDDDLNISLNLVRNRINKSMPKLSNNLVTANGLNMREEIRRERTVELFNEGFRIDDLKRWKTAETEMPKDFLGIKWTGTEYATKWPNVSYAKNSDGYIILETGRKWESKHYLYPLPTDQLQLNPNLKQNPGWGE